MLFDYQKEAEVTNSDVFHGELVSLTRLTAVLEDSIYALQQLDRVKKSLYYGRDSGFPLRIPTCEQVPQRIDPVLLHGIIGIATEAGELLEAVLATVRYGETLDEVNIIEEIGDVFWYQAILANKMDKSFYSIQRRNIAKLRKRYPEKFTEYDANNRDLFAEREALEGGE